MSANEFLSLIEKYAYRVIWSEEDGEHVGLCAEFPSLSWLDVSAEKAFLGIRNVVRQCIEDMYRNGESLPEPLSLKQFTGKFMVRIPPDIHRRLALEAAEAHVSLNRLVSAKLSG